MSMAGRCMARSTSSGIVVGPGIIRNSRPARTLIDRLPEEAGGGRLVCLSAAGCKAVSASCNARATRMGLRRAVAASTIRRRGKGAFMTNLTAIDASLQQACDAGAFPGAVAMATTGAEVIYQGAFGRRDLTGTAAMTADSVFWLASMTKAI